MRNLFAIHIFHFFYSKENLAFAVVFLSLMLAKAVAKDDTLHVTLTEAISHTLMNNLQLKQAQLKIVQAQLDLKQSRQAIYPNLNGSIAGGKNWGLNFDQISGQLITNSITYFTPELRSSVTLFDGWRTINQIAVNKERLSIRKTTVEKVKNDLTLSVLTTFVECLNARKIWDAALVQLMLSQNQLNMIQARFELGSVTSVDIAEAKNQIAGDKVHVTEAENTYRKLLLDLKQLMEFLPETQIVLKEPRLPEMENYFRSIDQVSLLHLDSSYPDLKLAALEIDAATRNLALSKANLYPTLTLGGGYGTNYSSQLTNNIYTGQPLTFWNQLNQNRAYSIYTTISIPIFQNFTSKIQVRKAEITVQEVRNEEKIAQNEFRKILDQAVLDVRAAYERYMAAKVSFGANQQSFYRTNESYKIGRSTIFEVTNVQTKMNQAEFDLIRARFDLFFKKKITDFYVGKSITEE